MATFHVVELPGYEELPVFVADSDGDDYHCFCFCLRGV